MITHKIPEESLPMKLLSVLNLAGFYWSLRRLHVPVDRDALVLEIGSGGNPYPRSNVLLDASLDSYERLEKIVIDRPIVIGIAEKLPFRDKCFDFIIASHVLEHTPFPEDFLSELMRVGRAGYIETPAAWFERICSFTYHRLEVAKLSSKLVITKKPSWKYTQSSDEWDQTLSKSTDLIKFIKKKPGLFHTRYYWVGNIDYKVNNPECDSNWDYPNQVYSDRKKKPMSKLSIIRNSYLAARRVIFSQSYRNKRLLIDEVLQCPNCGSAELFQMNNDYKCASCKKLYIGAKGIPFLFPDSSMKDGLCHMYKRLGLS